MSQSLFEEMADMMDATYSGVRNKILAWQAEGKLPEAYLPIFVNYAFFCQDYFKRLRPESRMLARRVADTVDSRGLFRSRTKALKP
jgi:hypothetical protein